MSLVKDALSPYYSRMTIRFGLADLLEQKGLSQRQLAKDSGVSFPTINRMYLNHNAMVSLDTLDKIAAVLGCEPCDLIVRDKSNRRK